MNSTLYGVPATAGTVMLAAFTTAGGGYCIVQAMVYDIMSMPQRPLTLPRLILLHPSEFLDATSRVAHRDQSASEEP